MSRPSPRPSALPTDTDKQRYVREMFDRIAPRYNLVNRVMTGGLDLRWRRRLVRSLGCKSGDRVLDLACGTGDFIAVWGAFGVQAIGCDLSFGMLKQLSSDAWAVQALGEQMPFADEAFDAVSTGFAVRNFQALGEVVAECARVLRPGGRLGILEVATPKFLPARVLHRWYFGAVVPWLGGLLSDARAYRYLPESLSYLPTPQEMAQLLYDNGFASFKRQVVGFGAAQLITVTKEFR
ncbi:MAG: ubiquinone/menaquinone biosynthesis methyltransferase [Ferrimicrobium sp.]